MWTYDKRRGLRVYDPYGHSKLSAHIEKAAMKEGIKAKVMAMCQQHEDDGWSCGYRVIKWVVRSAMQAPENAEWMEHPLTPDMERKWPELVERIDDLNLFEDKEGEETAGDATARKTWYKHPLFDKHGVGERSCEQMIAQTIQMLKYAKIEWARRKQGQNVRIECAQNTDHNRKPEEGEEEGGEVEDEKVQHPHSHSLTHPYIPHPPQPHARTSHPPHTHHTPTHAPSTTTHAHDHGMYSFGYGMHDIGHAIHKPEVPTSGSARTTPLKRKQEKQNEGSPKKPETGPLKRSRKAPASPSGEVVDLTRPAKRAKTEKPAKRPEAPPLTDGVGSGHSSKRRRIAIEGEDEEDEVRVVKRRAPLGNIGAQANRDLGRPPNLPPERREERKGDG
jgi:hypothetical protein